MTSPRVLKRQKKERRLGSLAHGRPLRGTLGVDIFVYVRASDPSQKDSCVQQIADLEEALRRARIELPPGGLPRCHDPERGVFMDDGVSGWKKGLGHRPGSKALLDVVRENRRRGRPPGTIFVWALSRLARFKRGAEQAIACLYAFRRMGWLVRSLTQPGLDSRSDDRLLRVIRAALEAEKDTLHSEDKSRHVHRGKRASVLAGKWVGGPPPFGMVRCIELKTEEGVQYVEMERGLHNGREDTVTVLRPGPQAGRVLQIFRWYVDGEDGTSFSLRSLARRLNDDGVPTADGAARWQPSTVRKILVNVRYIGYQNDSAGALHRARWDPVVPQDLWDRARARLAGNGRHGRGANAPYPLSGLISCAACHAPFWGDPGDGSVRYYRAKNATGEKTCGTCRLRVQARVLEDAVFDAIEGIVAHPVVLEAITAERVREEARGSDIGAQVEQVEQSIAACRRQIEAVLRTVGTLDGPASDIATRVVHEKSEAIANLERRRRDLLSGEADRDSAAEFARRASRFRDVYERATPAQRKELLSLFVVDVTVESPSTATVRIRRPAGVE